MYPALHRLEKAGLLTSRWSEGGRRKRIYELTRRGKGALREQERDWREFSRAVDVVLRG